jgi:hypothetical protein
MGLEYGHKTNINSILSQQDLFLPSFGLRNTHKLVLLQGDTKLRVFLYKM